MQQVARFDDLREDRGTRVTVSDTPILLVRSGADVHAFSADCPHAGAPLEEGALCNGRIVCPWHKGTFDASDGSVVEPPALVGLQRYPVSIENGNVLVSGIAEPAEPTKPAPGARPGNDNRTMAVIGAGAAGAAACAALRQAGFEGRLVLAGAERVAPYDRTSLSKFVLAGDMPPDEVPPLLPPDFLAAHRIERIDAEVVRLDASTRQIELSNDTKLQADAVLVCTGGIPKPMKEPGANLKGVHLLRTREDAVSILASLEGAKRAVVVGASFIGLEVASCLRKRNIDVTVVSPGHVPFARQFGEAIGGMIKKLHEENRVVFRMPARVASFLGDGAVSAVELQGGEKVLADVVIVGTGVRPATDFIDGLELADDGGVPVDSTMRAAPGIYAAGDIARFPLPRSAETVRIEHWRVAQQHARVAAANMAGVEERYVGVPFFWTYHFGKNLEYLGHASQHDDVVIDGDLDAQDFIAYLLHEGQVAAVVACQREAATARLAEAMRASLTLDEARRAVG
jgi:NADPH-dependent 2,4-dienoyl-CoA reductase/sulfur reductase-like enzyme/nitrite reductase/ring-hydroxylating ferredoxin subunit